MGERDRLKHPFKLPSGRWLCVCGRRHQSHITFCKCGFDRSVRPDRCVRVWPTTSQLYYALCCGYVREQP